MKNINKEIAKQEEIIINEEIIVKNNGLPEKISMIKYYCNYL
ncbi:hypothetical protein RGC78_13635 [Clostridium sp. 5N-1]|uniref:Uncharacterized protein n=1 Tax=Clostridium aquiflavi TaxID=3073603 RepID=A0ABU1EJD2_9CLOT|nr:hypothetical protein [Clostridium sp. 5N-1]